MSSSSSTILAIYNTIKSYNLYTSIIISIIGVIGNILNILVFGKLKFFRGNPCSFYLYFESIINLGALLFISISNTLTINGINPDRYSIIWCKIKSILNQIFIPVSLSIVCFAAIDQFFSTNPIFYIRKFSTLKICRYCIFFSICFWSLHSISVGIFANPYLGIICTLFNLTYIRYYLYFYYPALLGGIPICISSIFSLLAFRNVRRIVRRHVPIVRRRLDQQMTTLVFSRVIVLVILHVPYLIYYIYSFSFSFFTTNILQFMIGQLIQTILNSLTFLNSAITFYVFIVSSSRYRRQVKYLLIKKIWYYCKRLYYFKRNKIRPLRNNSIKSTTDID